jgi:hypothetical protein
MNLKVSVRNISQIDTSSNSSVLIKQLAIKEGITKCQIIKDTNSASLILLKINDKDVNKISFHLIFIFDDYLGFPAGGVIVMLPITFLDNKLELITQSSKNMRNIQGFISFLR